MIRRIYKEGKEIILIGTAHVSKESVEEVRELIRLESPDSVAVELCQGRFENLNNENRFDHLDIAEVLKKGQGLFVLANFLLSAYQKKIGDRLGVRPGAEMIAAIEEAGSMGIPLVLADRPIDVTLKRVTRQLRLRDKWNGLAGLLSALFSGGEDQEELDESAIEGLKDESILLDTLNDMGVNFPNVKRYLLDERDRYMANKIGEINGSKVVGVVGAGHLNGIAEYLAGEGVSNEEIDPLMVIPPKGHLGNIIAGLLLGAFLVMLTISILHNPISGMKDAGSWLILTASLGGLGALIAGGHPWSILASMVGAPIGAALPMISSGVFGAMVEAKLRRPQVRDFSSLAEDAFKPMKWRSNRLLRVFLIFFLASLGSAVGNIIGLRNILVGFIHVL